MAKPPDETPRPLTSHDDSGGFLSSSLARAGEHFAAKDTDPADAVEIWAKRLGRALSLVGVVFLAWFFGHQLKWW